MAVPTIQTALNAGELSPSIYGRVDLEKYRKGCSTCRNFFASYRGGAFSRAGTLFSGITKQGNQGTANLIPPPRNITFQYSAQQGIVLEFGEKYIRFLSNGGYITETPIAITGITNANPGVVSVANTWVNGDEIYLSGIAGPMGLRLNGRSLLVANRSAGSITLINTLDGTAINTSSFGAYVSGGTAARIYTLASPYAAVDIPWIKYTQSADVMSLCCVNETSLAEYPPYDLSRIQSNHWTLTKTTYAAIIQPPYSLSLSAASSGGTPNFYYPFVATAVDATTGQESIACPAAVILSVDIAAIASSITLTCSSVTGAGSYNFYGAPPSFGAPSPAGAFFGYIGSAFGPVFTDSNIVADFTKSPPLHKNPFATSFLKAVIMTAGGSNYSVTATTATVASPIGQNPVLLPVVSNGAIVWTSVQSGGAGMTGGETVVFTDATGRGSGVTATITVGPATGNFPSVVAYFQERRFYASTLNNPDTYFASQPGAFTNMDSTLPIQPSDAIIGSPWSQQVNGIQWMLNMPGGLVIFTGLGAWQVSGGGGGLATSTAITPFNQTANPQAYNGCSPLVPPIPINYDILYVQEKGSIVRDLSYNFFVNIYTGTDLTVLSNHLFNGHTIIEWGWSEEPNKLLWGVRDDGILLCLTYLKEQDVYAWTRHDTNGLFMSVCTVSEPPVNAPYFIVQRLIQNDGNPVWVNFQERMDNRLWDTLENSWCVDAGLSYSQNTPNATITVTSASGVPTLSQPTLIYGGANYSSSTFAEVNDPTGFGAVANLTIVGNVVTAVSVSGLLTGYTDPTFNIVDPTGAGGGAAVSIFSNALTTVKASSPIFANASGQGEIGDVIRMNGRTMAVTQFISNTQVQAVVLRNLAPSIPNDPLNTAVPVVAGQWSIAAPTTQVYGLDHLEGMLVSILADGVVVAPQIVQNGSITLPEPASAIVIGLGFTAQLQTMYLEIPGQVTVQGRRKEIDSVVARVTASGIPFSVGVNQPNAATQQGHIEVPWDNLTAVNAAPTGNSPQQPYGFVSADIFVNVFDQLSETGGQVAVQQTEPIPCNVLALIPWSRIQDDVDAA